MCVYVCSEQLFICQLLTIRAYTNLAWLKMQVGMLQIQRNLASDSSLVSVEKIAMVEVDSKAKVGASLGYTVRTLLNDLGLEVQAFTVHFTYV